MKKVLKRMSSTRRQDLAVCIIGVAMVMIAMVIH